MIRYIPDFILQNYEEHLWQGTLTAYVLLFDIADFTMISTALQKEGKAGAEELSKFLSLVFGEPIEIVGKFGGFVSEFAGDAFCAIFPEREPKPNSPQPADCADNVISAVNSIRTFFTDKTIYQSPFGDFFLKIRQTVCYGPVNWQIFRNVLQKEYVFYGSTLSELAELSSYKEDELFSTSAAKRAGLEHFNRLAAGYNLVTDTISDCTVPLEKQFSPTVKAMFIHPKYRMENPQNEIRYAAYCFANLNAVPPERREQAVEIIQNLADIYSGFVNKYDATDKGLIAIILFGLPRSDDKTLERICRFSLKAMESIPELAIGLASGNAFAGYTGKGEVREYTALGHPVNLAARLMSKANQNEILTDHYLYRELLTAYEFHYVGSTDIQGISYPIRSYRLSKKSYKNTGYQESNFLGRDEEIVRLTHIVDCSILASTNSIIYVAGDAGIGKTRLVKEILASYTETDYYKFPCYCDAILPKPLALIKQIIRIWCGFTYEQALEDGINAFRDMWAKLAHDDTELLRIESIIAALAGYEWSGSVWSMLPPQERPQQLQKAWVRFVKEITLHKPVILFLDDSQWIDAQSKELLQRACDADIKPMIVIAACRYQDGGTPPDLGLSMHQSFTINLNALNSSGSRLLVQSVLDIARLPEMTYHLIDNHAMGNPFFIEQLIFFLKENGKLDDQGEIDGDVGYINTMGISDVICSRIDRLTESLREMISHASVLGMEFNVKVLSRMLGCDLSTDLRTGMNNRLWENLDELRYVFSHIMIKDVVYQRMLSDRLTQLHLLAATSLECTFTDKLDFCAEEIAYHLEKGNELVKAAIYYDKAGNYFRENYLFTRSELNLTQAVTLREQLLGEQHPETAESLTNLAYLEQARSDYEQAELLFKQALAIFGTKTGKESPDTAAALNNLALLYGDQGRYTEAETLFLQGLQIREKTLGAEHLDTAKSLNDLACLYENLGRLEESEAMHLKALAIREKALGPDCLDTAVTMNNLATLYCSMGKYIKAEPYFLKVLAVFKKLFGEEHPDTAVIKDNLGMLYVYRDNNEQAELYLSKALAIREKILGAEHPDTAYSLNNLSTLYRNMFQDDQAELLCRRALAIREKVLGMEHPLTAMTLNNLARLAQDRDEFEQAESLYLRALSIFEFNQDTEHPNIATLLENLASLYRACKQDEKARPILMRVLEIRDKTLGKEHPCTIQTQNDLDGFETE